jgi:hypothetical protein
MASVNRKQGWFTLGQYGLGSHDWDPTKSKGILIRNIPGSTQQLVKKPDNIQRRWYKSTTRTKHGLYEMTSTNTSYCALSGFYYHNGDALFSHLEIDHAAMVHTSLTRLISSGANYGMTLDLAPARNVMRTCRGCPTARLTTTPSGSNSYRAASPKHTSFTLT